MPASHLRDFLLADAEGAGTLVAIAREGRLSRGHTKVCPNWVDEAALALVDRAIQRKCSLSLLYPAPAGQVSVLLAAQVLIRAFITNQRSQSVGLVTADPVGAARALEELVVSSSGTRARLVEVFPVWRATPTGQSPFGTSHFRGLLVGPRCLDWRTPVVIQDSLAGSTTATADTTIIRLTADPFDQGLNEAASRNEAIWGWSEGVLRAGGVHELDSIPAGCAPFSVARDRLSALAGGCEIVVVCCAHNEAEAALRNLRNDLQTLGAVAETSARLMPGLKVAWSHASTLISLPCRPSDYDRYGGIPPYAARRTDTFEPEMAAWAKTLSGDVADYVSVVASDLGDLRAALDKQNPMIEALRQLAHDGVPTVSVVRTRTAARALLAGLSGDPDGVSYRSMRVVSYAGLHREPCWPRAVVVGPPARWTWHRVDSGLGEELRVLALGELEGKRVTWGLSRLRAARDSWVRPGLRDHAWRVLVGSAPPAETLPPPRPELSPEVLFGPSAREETNPFAPLAELAVTSPLIDTESESDALASLSDAGDWTALVQSVEVETTEGTILLPGSREMDIVVSDRIETCLAGDLRPGMEMILGRQAGRLGLLEALEATLRHSRPDLMAAHLLVSHFRGQVLSTYHELQIEPARLHERLRALGCGKDFQTTRSWVSAAGPMAPRDFQDIQMLATALSLGMPTRRLQEIFAGVQRIRGFRRSAGRALARSAAASITSPDVQRVDEDLGLSVADLQAAVMQVTVLSVRDCGEPVPLSATGHLMRS